MIMRLCHRQAGFRDAVLDTAFLGMWLRIFLHSCWLSICMVLWTAGTFGENRIQGYLD